MKKFKKMMVGVVLAVTLLGNCLTAAAFDSQSKCVGCNNVLEGNEIYENNYAYTEYYTHPVQKNTSYIVCSVRRDYYRVRYFCRDCGKENLCHEYYDDHSIAH